MNLKNIFFCMFMMSMSLTSNVALAWGSPNFDGVDKVVVAALTGTLGVGIGGTYGATKRGPLGFLVGSAVGGSSGAVIGWISLVAIQALCNNK